jgi:hypothetical protein
MTTHVIDTVAEANLALIANNGVKVTDSIPGTAATNLGKAVDGAAGTNDVGVAALCVRRDIPTTITPVDGDYTRIGADSLGRQWVHIGASDAGPLPNGATVVMGTADGAAGAAVTASMPVASTKINYVMGYSVVVDTAALTNGITITLKDDTTTKSIIDALPALAAVGSKANMCSSVPIMATTVSKAANLVVSASTGTSVVHATIWGYTL